MACLRPNQTLRQNSHFQRHPGNHPKPMAEICDGQEQITQPRRRNRRTLVNAATPAWNTYIDAIKNHRYAEMLAVSAPLLEELKKLENCDPALLGSYAHLVASGFEHKAYLVANSRPKEITETPAADDGEEQASSPDVATPAHPQRPPAAPRVAPPTPL